MGLDSWFFLPRISKRYVQQRDRLGLVTATMEEDLAARRDIRYAGAVAQRTAEFAGLAWDHRRALRRALLSAQFFTATLSFLTYLMIGLVYNATGREVLTRGMAVGTAVAVTLLGQQAARPVQTVAQYVRDLQRTRISWRRLWEPFDQPGLPVESASPEPLPALAGKLELRNVRFAYPGTGRIVLDDVSLTLEPGSCTALVGYTGAGKSSITKLLIRTYDPDAGEVLADGHDLRNVSLREYRRQVGVVPQDAFLFRGTVRSNIAYARPDATDAEVEGAAQAVGAYEILAALPNAFDHEVQEEGRNLTGAQAQLVALARAWLSRPAVMVLDEATSSLDLELEKKVLDATKALDCTVLMVTHRPSVVELADEVVVIEGGRIAQQGTRAEVVGSGGAYDRLWVAEPAGKKR
jgi:ATP-binding cassette subfamily B protein